MKHRPLPKFANQSRQIFLKIFQQFPVDISMGFILVKLHTKRNCVFLAMEVYNLVFSFKMSCELVSTAVSQQSAASVFTQQSRTAVSQQSAARLQQISLITPR
jgi:hypothetical protein